MPVAAVRESGSGPSRRVQRLTISVAIGAERTWLDPLMVPPGREWAPIIDKVPFVEAINDAWRLVALATLECSLLPPWQDAPRLETCRRGTVI